MSGFALLTVSDKSGIASFASGLSELGWVIFATEGTFEALRDMRISPLRLRQVRKLAGNVPPLEGGRLKTLSARTMASVLANLSSEEDKAVLRRERIPAVNLVVCNFYPFSDVPSVERIDVGGPALAAAAAKNFARVTVVVRPDDYDGVLSEIRAQGEVSLERRMHLAAVALSMVGSYYERVAREVSQGRLSGAT
ncbi:MAG: hypothetical protein Q8Q38_00530 [bacterium]|nr:hypothetical protein [bacterium]MDZ4232016.1 hypothetical protein [Candidatus Pacearchaeota archaeon]